MRNQPKLPLDSPHRTLHAPEEGLRRLNSNDPTDVQTFAFYVDEAKNKDRTPAGEQRRLEALEFLGECFDSLLPLDLWVPNLPMEDEQARSILLSTPKRFASWLEWHGAAGLAFVSNRLIRASTKTFQDKEEVSAWTRIHSVMAEVFVYSYREEDKQSEPEQWDELDRRVRNWLGHGNRNAFMQWSGHEMVAVSRDFSRLETFIWPKDRTSAETRARNSLRFRTIKVRDKMPRQLQNRHIRRVLLEIDDGLFKER